MKKKGNGKRRQFSKMGKRSAAKLTAAERSARGRHAALVRHGLSESERQKDEREAAKTITEIRAEMRWHARQLIDDPANENVAIGTLAARLQRRHKFYLTADAARKLVEEQIAGREQGIVTPKVPIDPRFIADHVVLIPKEPKQN